MKLRKFSLSLLIVVCLAIIPITASAGAAISLNAVSSIHPGESVTISGTSTFDEVIIKVLRPNNSNVYFDIAKVTSGSFSSTFKLGGSEATGTYKVVAGQADSVDTKDLTVTAIPGSPPPPPPSGTGTDSTPPPGKNVPDPTPITGPVAVDTSKNKVVKATDANGTVTTTVIQDKDQLDNAFKQLQKGDQGAPQIVSITLNNGAGAAVISLPASSLANAASATPNAIVLVHTDSGHYALPVSVLDFSALAGSLGTSSDQINISINIAPVNKGVADQIDNSGKQSGVTPLGVAVDFSITASGNGKTVTLNNFGTNYVERSIVLAIPIDGNNATAVVFDPATGQLSFVPAEFVNNADGTTEVKIKRNGNSIYTVVSSTKSFEDISGHWAKSSIELLASKLVVSGTSDTSFAPDTSITRAEFAALLVRALALPAEADKSSASFNDVKDSDWYAGIVGAAVKAKLVSGYEDHTFKPTDKITREQMAVMITNAITAAGKKVDEAGKEDVSLAKFKDRTAISAWAKTSVSQSVVAGIINGMTEETFAPAEDATRAQAVVMLEKMLQYVHFIN